MENLRVFADFHNADALARLRLNCIGQEIAEGKAKPLDYERFFS